MKRSKFYLALTVLMIACVTCFAVPVWADGYTYKVTVSGGDQGEGSKTMQVAYGGTITIDPDVIKVKNDKYYLKGFHVSGQESPVVQAGDIPAIQEDLDLVATYGIKQSMVKYTVRYVDENEQEIIEAKTYYGNVGDKPVLAFTMIEGYKPDAYALTKTLTENEDENLFVFTYTSTAEEEGSSDDEQSSDESGDDGEGTDESGSDGSQSSDDSDTDADADGSNTSGSNGTDNTTGTTTAGNNGTGRVNATGATGNIFQGNAAGNDNGSNVDDTEDNGSDVVDLDDQDVAKASGSDEEKNGGGANAGLIAGAAAAAAILIILAALIMKRRKTGDQ